MFGSYENWHSHRELGSTLPQHPNPNQTEGTHKPWYCTNWHGLAPNESSPERRKPSPPLPPAASRGPWSLRCGGHWVRETRGAKPVPMSGTWEEAEAQRADPSAFCAHGSGRLADGSVMRRLGYMYLCSRTHTRVRLAYHGLAIRWGSTHHAYFSNLISPSFFLLILVIITILFLFSKATKYNEWL